MHYNLHGILISLLIFSILIISGCTSPGYISTRSSDQLCRTISASWLHSTETINRLRAELNRRGRSCIGDTLDKHSLEILCNPNFFIDPAERDKELIRRGRSCPDSSAFNDTYSKSESMIDALNKPKKYQGSPSKCSIDNSKKSWLLEKLDKYDFPKEYRQKEYINDGNIYNCKWSDGTSISYMEDYGNYWSQNGLVQRNFYDGTSYFGYKKNGKKDNYGLYWGKNGYQFKGEYSDGNKGIGTLWYPETKSHQLRTEIFSYKGSNFEITSRYYSTRILKDSEIAKVTISITVNYSNSYPSFIEKKLTELSPTRIILSGKRGQSGDLYTISEIDTTPVTSKTNQIIEKLKIIINEYEADKKARSIKKEREKEAKRIRYEQDKKDRRPDRVCTLTASEIIYEDGNKTNYLSKEKEIVKFVKFIEKGFLIGDKDWRLDDWVDWREGVGYQNMAEKGLFCETGLLSITCSGRKFNSRFSTKVNFDKLTNELLIENDESDEVHRKEYLCEETD